MSGFDLSEIVNPKKTMARREAEAEHGKPPASAASAASGGMSQADFTKTRKLTPQQEQMKQKKLAEKLRSRDY